MEKGIYSVARQFLSLYTITGFVALFLTLYGLVLLSTGGIDLQPVGHCFVAGFGFEPFSALRIIGGPV